MCLNHPQLILNPLVIQNLTGIPT